MISCNNCKNNSHLYADGYVFKDWSGKFEGNLSDLPKEPDRDMFWTYKACSKNNKGLKYLNLDGKCPAFIKK